MRYDLIPHVRLYKLKALHQKLGWEGRTVLWHLRLEADALGCFEVEAGSEAVDVAKELDLSVVVFVEGMAKLVEHEAVRWESPEGKLTPRWVEVRGVGLCEGGTIRIVDFAESEKAHRSSSLRWREFDRRRRASEKQTLRLGSKRGVGKLSFVPEAISAEAAREQGLITRTRAAEIMGVSLATLRRREGTTLRPLLTDLGEHVFREEEVRAAAIKGLAPKTAPRPPRSEQSGDPIWRERAARLLDQMEGQQYSTGELAVLAKRCGIKDTVVADLLAAADGVELQKVDGKWSAIAPKKDGK